MLPCTTAAESDARATRWVREEGDIAGGVIGAVVMVGVVAVMVMMPPGFGRSREDERHSGSDYQGLFHFGTSPYR